MEVKATRGSAGLWAASGIFAQPLGAVPLREVKIIPLITKPYNQGEKEGSGTDCDQS